MSESGKVSLISCRSTGLKEAQMHYSTYDLELSALVFACKKLSDYMIGRTHFTVFLDHKPLEGLHNKQLYKVAANLAMRVMEEILSHNVSVRHIKACRNSVANCLSRLPTNTKEMPHWEKFFKPINKITKGQKQISTYSQYSAVPVQAKII